MQKLSSKAFGKPIDFAVVKSAISIFEQSLLTNENNVNKYIRGQDVKINYKGLQLFDVNCASCHMQNTLSKKIGNSDFEGRFRLTKDSVDFGIVKAPRLENIKDSPGFFHNDEEVTLYRAIKRHDLELSFREIHKIKSFITNDLHDSRF